MPLWAMYRQSSAGCDRYMPPLGTTICVIYMIVHRITFVFLQYVLKNMEKNKRRKGYKLARRFEEAHFDFGIG